MSFASELRGSVGSADVEVWPSSGSKGFDVGPVGYSGASGWWISKAFGDSKAFEKSPEFYRAYDATDEKNRPLLEAKGFSYEDEMSSYIGDDFLWRC